MYRPLRKKLDSMLRMFLPPRTLLLHFTVPILKHSCSSSHVRFPDAGAAVMALAPTGEPHRIPIGFLFSHLNRITNDTRPGNSNNWCLSVVRLTSTDELTNLRAPIRGIAAFFPALNFKRAAQRPSRNQERKNMGNSILEADSVNLYYDFRFAHRYRISAYVIKQ